MAAYPARDRLQPVETANGSLRPDRRWVQLAKRGECAVAAFEREHCDGRWAVFHRRYMHGACIAPQAKKGRPTRRELAAGRAPAFFFHNDSRPRTVAGNPMSLRNNFGD